MGNLTTKGIGWAIAGACFFAFYRKNQQEIDYAVDEMDAAAYPDYVPQAYEPAEEQPEVVEFEIDTNGDGAGEGHDQSPEA